MYSSSAEYIAGQGVLLLVYSVNSIDTQMTVEVGRGAVLRLDGVCQRPLRAWLSSTWGPR